MHKTLAKKAPVRTAKKASEIILLVSTSKGGFIYYSDEKRRFWEVNGPYLLGSIVHHMILDPRDSKTILMAAQTKTHGPMIFKSVDFGMNWVPVKIPPKFSTSKKVAHIYRLTPGHISEPNVWYAGTSPQGLFKSENFGDTWQEVSGFNNHSQIDEWCGNSVSSTLKYEKIHSIMIHPQNARSLIIGMASGGIFESMDGGESWTSMNEGLLTTDISDSLGRDPHLVVQHPMDPSYIYQQNQGGIFRLDAGSRVWKHIGAGIDVGDIGFSLCVHPQDPNTLWVFPMEGTDIWSRVCTGGQPAVYCSQDGGDSWFRQDIGFPMWHAWFTVMSKAMVSDHYDSVGLYIGTTNGSIWHSDNDGNSWRQIITHLPKIYALEVGYTKK